MGEQDWFDRDYYAVLGVAKDASEKDIRKAYRKLARQWHPDQNAGDAKAEAKFKEIGEAFAVLNDKEQREKYDAIRAMASGGPRFAAGGPGGPGGFEDLFGAYGGGNPNVQFSSGGQGGFEDILSSMFGGGGGFGGGFSAAGGRSGGYGSPRPQKGADLATATEISFEQAFTGETLTFNLEGKPTKVRIPAGVRDGQKIKLAGKGQPGVAGGPAGDLIVEVKVKADPLYTMDKDRLRIKVPITYPEAALGTTIDVPIPDGSTVKARVPAGTSSGAVLRLKGKGVKKGNRQGDVLVDLSIVAPKKPGEAELKAAEALREAQQGWNPRADLRRSGAR